MPIAILGDACNPAVPGCHPEAQGATVTFLGILLIALAIIATVVGLVIFALVAIVRPKRRRALPLQIGGWFPDPSAQHRWRWWDGAGWTSAVSDGEAPRVGGD